jgi:hypothetical protein
VAALSAPSASEETLLIRALGRLVRALLCDVFAEELSMHAHTSGYEHASAHGPAHPGVGKGADKSMVWTGVVVALVGAAAASVGLLTPVGLRLGPIPIPLSVVGPLALLAGIGAAIWGLRQWKCLRCNASLELATACYPPEMAGAIVSSLRTGELAWLAGVPLGPPADPHLQVAVESCDACRAVATVDVDLCEPKRTSLLRHHVVAGPAVATLVDCVRARQEAELR